MEQRLEFGGGPDLEALNSSATVRSCKITKFAQLSRHFFEMNNHQIFAC